MMGIGLALIALCIIVVIAKAWFDLRRMNK